MKRREFVGLVVPLAAGAALSVYSVGAVAANAEKKSITVGADTTFPPFETEKNGEVTGFDIDMIKGIAKAAGLSLTIRTMPFEGIIPSLQAGEIDAAVAGITITKARMKNVDFSDAYYKSGLSVLVKADSKIKDFSDLKGHVVATKKGTSSVTYLTSHGFDLGHVKEFQNISSAYQALEIGEVDAVLFDNPVNVNFELGHKNVKVVGGLLTGEYYGIAISRKDPWLVAKINAGLAELRKSGEYQKLFVEWFGEDKSGLVEGLEPPASVAVTD
ncbi:MAG: transporter substrate-binding domain-containing protein [Acetobacteraceae bacterium]